MQFDKRIARVREALRKRNLDALLVSKLANIFYLSGFTGSTAHVVITEENALFLTDFRYREQFYEEVASGYELIDFYNESLSEKLAGLSKKYNYKKLGVEAGFLPYSQVEELKASSEFVTLPQSTLIEEFREVKDEEEVALISEAVRLVEQVFQELISVVKVGVTEIELAAEFEYRIRKKNVKQASFSPIVAFGPNSAKPHARYSTQEVIPGVPLTFDLGVSYCGYCSDLTRTVFLGGTSEGWERIHFIVREAKEVAADFGKAGTSCADLDRSARAVIEGQGYGDAFGHGLGHGVGIEVHESPRISKTSKQVLKEGSIITIEPGIYLSKQGGLRIEDMYLVEKKGLRRLNNLPADLLVIS